MKIEPIQWCSPEYQQALDLRHRVLREPLGLQFSAEDLDSEFAHVHYAAIRDGRIIGTAVICRIDADAVRLRQMSVDPEFQGQGIGTAIIHQVESDLAEQGTKLIRMHSRETAIGFYERLGFQIEGEPFEEVGILHRVMHKKIDR